MPIDGYYLGCPFWGFKGWTGNLYRRDAKPREFLRQYAEVYNAVEGNTTFYSLPSEENVARWRDQVPASFRFCCKLHRAITHDKGLEDTAGETSEFLARLAPLGERLGPFMVQLPATFGPDRLGVLDRYLASLPRDLCFAVELRHRGFYREPVRERVDELLAERGCERIVIDTGGLRSGDQRHPDLLAARHRKPDLPISSTALGPYPFLRLICHPDQAANLPWLERWSWHIARWVRQGKRPFAIVHCPNNLYSPPLTRRLHAYVSEHVEVGEIAPWPGEEDAGKGQLSLL